MYLDTPPRLIETKVFSAMPDEFRRKGARTEWADANRPGQPTDCFIEGPSFDADGNLYIVDIPFGRIFRISPDSKWSLVVEYDGWPNGLKISRRRAHPRRRLQAWHHGTRCAGRADAAGADGAQFRNPSGAATICTSPRMATSISPTRDRPACTIRPGGSIGFRRRAARLPDRHRHQPQRPGARSHRDRAVRRDDARQRGLARALHEGRQRLQGRPLLLDVRRQRPRRH